MYLLGSHPSAPCSRLRLNTTSEKPCIVTAHMDKLALSTSGRVLPEHLPVDGGGRMAQRHPGICRRKSSPAERTQADPSVTAEKPQAQALLSRCLLSDIALPADTTKDAL